MISGYQMSHDGGAIDDLAVDPTNPHAGDDDNDDLSSGELAILLLPVGVQPDDGLLLPY
jgi:hypothetical protein